MANATTSISTATNRTSRREFLYYIWGASIAIYAAQFSGLLIWFLIPRFREGEFGGKFTLLLEDIPDVNAPPNAFPDGVFWLVNLNSEQPNIRFDLAPDEKDEGKTFKGVAAIYKVCTHLGCIYPWTPANERFECPCHGSKYRLDGRRIESPAPRTLDRFPIEFLDANKIPIPGTQSKLVDDFYESVLMPEGAAFISVDTGARKLGPTETLLCEFVNACP